MSDESVSTNTLDSLYNILKCDITDIVQFTATSNEINKKNE